MLHKRLAGWAQRFCPVSRHLRAGYHWSFMQVEYATDVVFEKQATFQPLYETILHTAVHVINAEHVAFLTLTRSELAISGFRAADLRAHIGSLAPGCASYILK